MIDALDQILAFNNVSLNLYFKTLAPLEFTEVEDVDDQEVIEEETGIKMAADPEFTKEDEKEWLEYPC